MAGGLCAQFGPPGPPPPAPGKPGAPVDLTGYWVSYVTEDWRWRMVTPLKGDAASIPTNAEGRRVTGCMGSSQGRSRGLAMQVVWGAGAYANSRTSAYHLAGRHNAEDRNRCRPADSPAAFFGRSLRAEALPSWQGYSAANVGGRFAERQSTGWFGLGIAPRLGSQSRSLEVTTTQLRPGYLRKNGVPYSDKAVLKEYFDVFSEPKADTWLMVMTVVEDPTYLALPFVTTSHFKKIPDASGWDPQPCTAR